MNAESENRPSYRRSRRRFAKVLLVATIVLAALAPILLPRALDETAVEGTVVSTVTGTPIAGATINVWSTPMHPSRHNTDEAGRFNFSLAPGPYHIYILADDPSTLGADYVPFHAEVQLPQDGGDMGTIGLKPGASVVIEGDLQFVVTEDLPVRVGYEVIDPATGDVMTMNGLRLEYGTSDGAQSELLDLEPRHLIVPLETPFTVNVNATVLTGGEFKQLSFDADEPGLAGLAQGEELRIDVRKHTLTYNLGDVEALLERVEGRVYDMEADGFYLTVEKETLTSAIGLIDDAKVSLQEGLYIDGFRALKTAFLSLVNLAKGSDIMYEDAVLSVYILVFFVGVSSTFLSFFLSDGSVRQAGGSIAASAVFLSLLHLTYPGVRYVPTEYFVAASILSVATSITMATFVPRVLRAGRAGERVSFLNMIVPIFSIARRSLKRRRLRFALTLASVVLFVMAFVVLTSFSQGYGLMTRRMANQIAPVNGVMIRDRAWKMDAPTFVIANEITTEWLRNQPESVIMAQKAENIPVLTPLLQNEELSIRGILGIDPEAETLFTSIDEIATRGVGIQLSADEMLVSLSLRDTPGIRLGEELTFYSHTLRVAGFFDDEKVRELRDIDGSEFLPSKLAFVNLEGDAPVLVQEACLPSETIICDLETALGLPLTGVSRIDILVDERSDAREFAERLALERGYKAWSSSAEGLYVASLGTYIQGKGLPVLIPGIIVVLNVGAMMLNAMFERGREINILSAIGLNPAQISAIFVAEAAIIGVIGGGMGYLLGLGLYKTMALLQLTVEVGQKVSAAWSLGAVGISMTAVVVGAVFALKRSVVITPSLIRRWRVERREKSTFDPYTIQIPIKLHEEELDDFMDYALSVLRFYLDHPSYMTAMIKVDESVGGNVVRSITFIYRATTTMVGHFYTKNDLLIEKSVDDVFDVRLVSTGEMEWAHKTGSMIRQIAIEYSTWRKGSVLR
ncbi:MAG: FtsX-like permease family protein [Candidatus Bathyarchaeota archaeon]|nr:MAG: FtsX-like permease family protein [Candidatus Bathyarchaeota archaeon]